MILHKFKRWEKNEKTSKNENSGDVYGILFCVGIKLSKF